MDEEQARSQQTTDQVTARIKELVCRELDLMEKSFALDEGGLDRLSKIALILQRIRQPVAGKDNGSELTDEQIRKAAKE